MNRTTRLILLVATLATLMLILAGCTTQSVPRPMPVDSSVPPPPPPPPPPPKRGPKFRNAPANPNFSLGSEFHQVRIFYATDRKETGAGEFGGERGASLSYGTLFVSIPLEHAAGNIERPSVWKLEFSEKPDEHMVIMRRTTASHDDFFASVRDVIARGGKEASFLFVHGYNVAFDDAARRTAQITYDLNFAGAPVFYSWPSQATLQGYPTDENNVQWSEANLKGFLLDYAQNSGAKDIYLIAHSMGNRALTGAVKTLFAEHPELKGRFKEIILTAPDIDADIFKRDIAPALAAGCDKITLYVSDGDKALLASKAVHGYPRAGDSATGIVVVPGIETVDASGLDTSFLEHSYFAETGSVLMDIRKLILEQMRASQRGLKEQQQAAGRYWKFELPGVP
jgi:esterase/lipase superfamily enzyme